jgi:hypothetical protein
MSAQLLDRVIRPVFPVDPSQSRISQLHDIIRLARRGRRFVELFATIREKQLFLGRAGVPSSMAT